MSQEAMGKVIFKNGHEEPIVFYAKFDPYNIVFHTASTMYKYYRHLKTTSNGLLYTGHDFIRYMPYRDAWTCDEFIDRIELKED